MVVAYNNTIATDWFLMSTPFVVAAFLAGAYRYRKRKKETEAWLKGGITRDKD